MRIDHSLPLSVALIALAVAASSLPQDGQAQVATSVDGQRLNRTMMRMQRFGGNADGGSDRVAFSDANLSAMRYVESLMVEAGLETFIDAAGNLVGRRDGSEPGLSPIVTGSHIDTVPNGGHYDGVVGSLAAVEVARSLNQAAVETRHPLEFVIWSNEEGGKTGSRAVAGAVTAVEFELKSLGERTIGEGIEFLGGERFQLEEVERQAGDIAAYVELHVEQGAELDRRDVAIGVVEGIVGIRRWNVTVTGKANHAGTTPMDQRDDALYAAARFAVMVRDIITADPGAQVATIGRISAEPGAPNVIPGRVTLSLEMRDLSMPKLNELYQRIQRESDDLAARTGTTIEFEQFYESPAAPTDESLQQIIEAAATVRGLSHRRMPSGAGHDAQSLAPIGPIGMIFIPSRDGVSHAPSEFTSEEAIENGANVLLDSLLAIDRNFD